MNLLEAVLMGILTWGIQVYVFLWNRPVGVSHEYRETLDLAIFSNTLIVTILFAIK